MNENRLNKKKFLNQAVDYFRSNLKIILIFLIICFLFFLSYQVYKINSLSKIQNNSIDFFNTQNFEDLNLVKETISKLSNKNNFYGVLSQLELIQINLKNKKYEEVIILYEKLLKNKNLDNTYKSAIASKASYQFININFADLSKDYFKIIIYFISMIDDEIESYQGMKLELNYLIKILEVERNNINYLNYNEIIDLYNGIINSDFTSANIKERINKIHEFYSYK